MKITDLLEFFPIVEMLDTTFDSATQWTIQHGKDHMVGDVDGIEVQVELDPISFHSLRGINVIFRTKVDGAFTEETQNFNVTTAAKIIGAVTNATKQRLAEYDWEFVLVVAKNSRETRAKLYSRILSRLSRELHLNVVPPKQRGQDLYLLLTKPNVNISNFELP